jgi:hypothetical protein
MGSYLDSAWGAWLRPRPFPALIISDWNRTMLAILAGLAFTFFLSGYWWPYYRTADMDIFVSYEAFLFNDHLPQEYFDHPGYLTILLVGGWFRLLHAIGLLDVHALSELPGGGSGPESVPAWTAAVRAGRLLSLFVAEGFVLAFALLLRRLVKDWRVAVMGAFFFAFSGGLAMAARIMRTEMLSAGPAMLGVLILLLAAERPRSSWRPLLIGVAAFLMTAAVINKVQAILLIAATPLLLLPFGLSAEEEAKGIWKEGPRAWRAAGTAGAIALVLAIPAAPLVWAGLMQVPEEVHPLRLGGLPLYQPLLAFWIVGCMVVFARLWRVGLAETVASFAAIVSGLALGLLLLNIRYDLRNVIAVMNPLEHMLGFASSPHLAADHSMFGAGMLGALFDGFLNELARTTYFLYPSPRPAIFLEWFVIPAAIAAWRAGERKLALQVAFLLGAAAIDTLGTLRGLKLDYFLYTDPLIIIAAALMVSRYTALQHHRWVYQIGCLLIVVHIAFGLAEPIKGDFRRSVPLDFCQPHFYQTRRIELLPFCPT